MQPSAPLVGAAPAISAVPPSWPSLTTRGPRSRTRRVGASGADAMPGDPTMSAEPRTHPGRERALRRGSTGGWLVSSSRSSRCRVEATWESRGTRRDWSIPGVVSSRRAAAVHRGRGRGALGARHPSRTRPRSTPRGTRTGRAWGGSWTFKTREKELIHVETKRLTCSDRRHRGLRPPCATPSPDAHLVGPHATIRRGDLARGSRTHVVRALIAAGATVDAARNKATPTLSGRADSLRGH